MHEYYQPTEYEQQLIAAQMVTAESLDADYQEYLVQTKGDEFQMDYQCWQNQKRYWDALNAEYKRDIEPFQQDGLSSEKIKQQERLLREMTYCEQALGY